MHGRSPTQCFGSDISPGSVEAEQLEPPHGVGGQVDGHQPVGVRLEAGEGKPAEPGLLQPADVAFDMGVGPHGDGEVDRVSLRVGQEAPVAVVEAGKRLRWAPDGGAPAGRSAGWQREACDRR